jgi:hypothetical protein
VCLTHMSSLLCPPYLFPPSARAAALGGRCHHRGGHHVRLPCPTQGCTPGVRRPAKLGLALGTHTHPQRVAARCWRGAGWRGCAGFLLVVPACVLPPPPLSGGFGVAAPAFFVGDSSVSLTSTPSQPPPPASPPPPFPVPELELYLPQLRQRMVGGHTHTGIYTFPHSHQSNKPFTSSDPTTIGSPPAPPSPVSPPPQAPSLVDAVLCGVVRRTGACTACTSLPPTHPHHQESHLSLHAPPLWPACASGSSRPCSAPCRCTCTLRTGAGGAPGPRAARPSDVTPHRGRTCAPGRCGERRRCRGVWCKSRLCF